MEIGKSDTTRSLSVWAAWSILREYAAGGVFELEDCSAHSLWVNFKVTRELRHDSNELGIILRGDYYDQNGQIKSHELKLCITQRALENISQTRLESYLFGHMREMEADIERECRSQGKHRSIPDQYGEW